MRQPATRVVMLTATHDGSLISRAAAAGVCGFVAKTGAFGEVLSAIRTARSGSMVIDPTVLARLVPSPRKTVEAESDRMVAPLLTPREQEVLGLLGAGMDARAIARTLSISLHTCRGYVKSVLAKLDCHSQLEAVVAAGRMGLLPPPGGATLSLWSPPRPPALRRRPGTRTARGGQRDGSRGGRCDRRDHLRPVVQSQALRQAEGGGEVVATRVVAPLVNQGVYDGDCTR